jgi:CobQ-like glutamine amidotransferase family enzyme
LGHYFLTHDGQRLPGLGILDVHTIGGKKRLIGNCVVSGALEKPEKQQTLPFVGFENHSGRTYHGPKVRPLGQVLVGYGDNAEDHKAGAVYRNIIGCYLHGPLLPKNPQLADHLILQALRRKYGDSVTLSPLDDTLELQAQQTMVKRLGC